MPAAGGLLETRTFWPCGQRLAPTSPPRLQILPATAVATRAHDRNRAFHAGIVNRVSHGGQLNRLNLVPRRRRCIYPRRNIPIHGRFASCPSQRRFPVVLSDHRVPRATKAPLLTRSYPYRPLSPVRTFLANH